MLTLMRVFEKHSREEQSVLFPEEPHWIILRLFLHIDGHKGVTQARSADRFWMNF